MAELYREFKAIIMETSFITSFSEQDFRKFLKAIIKEILLEETNQIRSSLPETFEIKEAASFLKLKITTLYEKTSRKLIPHFKKGNKLYFNRVELEDWIKKGRVKTKSDIDNEAATYLLKNKGK